MKDANLLQWIILYSFIFEINAFLSVSNRFTKGRLHSFVSPKPTDSEQGYHDHEENVAFKDFSFVEEEYEAYSRCLSPRQERDKLFSELEKETKLDVTKSNFQKALRYPQRLIQKSLRRKKKPGKLLLMRCGESTFNANGTFTGWLDPDLTDKGVQQSIHAAQVLLAEGFDQPDVVYTSRLQRAIKSVWVILEELNSLYLPVYKTYRLNPRMYGALQGLSKQETAKTLGVNTVKAWQRSLKAKPPPLDDQNDPKHPKNDPRYRDLSPAEIPSTESLLDCQRRAEPLWEYKIRKDLKEGKTVLVVAHLDTIRGLIKVIDNLDDEKIKDVTLPNCMPVVYRFDDEMKPIVNEEKKKLAQVHTSATFLQDPRTVNNALEEMQEKFTNLYRKIEDQDIKRTAPLKASLNKLRQAQNLTNNIASVVLASESSHTESIYDDNGNSVKLYGNDTNSFVYEGERWADDPIEFEEYDEFDVDDEDFNKQVPVMNVVSLPKTSVKESKQVHNKQDDSHIVSVIPAPKPNDAVVVLIRHGRTPHNNLGLFTGWEDPPLTEGGVDDARNAGRLLKRHGFEFDVVYTSWLTRAIQTAYHVLDELDCMWLPIVKSWRLNERMYGALTGKSKKMIANEYGEEQLIKWRRGFAIQPPPVSSYSPNYPGNDPKRTKHFQDIRISIRETINRSLEQRKLVLHRKFPKTESLKDCMARSIPFYTKRIQKDAIEKGKRVLITSHENAIRGILMHLCNIPPEAMNQLHLPNGLPLVYSVKGKCITLLDDGSGRDPYEVHDFGPAAKYLFRPCALEDDFYDSMPVKEQT